MSFLDFEDYVINGEMWKINRDKTVIIYISSFRLYRAWGKGNIASPIDDHTCYVLRNIYVRPEARRQGVFTDHMDQMYCYCMFRNIPLFLMPAPFSFDICPFQSPGKAKVIPHYLQERKTLYDMYTALGFVCVKSAYYNPEESHRTKIINTTISGDPKKRRANENEAFAPIMVKENFGYQWLATPYHPILPEEIYNCEGLAES